MRTVRRYFNFGDAALAKTLLDDYEIFCRIFDEHSHRSIGLFWAVPVRLVVADVQIERAARILRYIENATPSGSEEQEDTKSLPVLDERIFGPTELETADLPPPTGNNPWEILAIAYLFLVPAIGFLLENRTLMLWIKPWGVNQFLVLTPREVHFVGTLLAGGALVLIASYFYMRREIAGAGLAQVEDL